MIHKTIHFLERHKMLLTFLFVAFTILTLLLTLMPSENLIESKLWNYDKAGHAFLFGSWTFLFGLYLLFATKRELPLIAIFLIGSFFGISIEILQEILPINRSGDPFDALTDIAGCGAAVIFLKLLTLKPGKRQN